MAYEVAFSSLLQKTFIQADGLSLLAYCNYIKDYGE